MQESCPSPAVLPPPEAFARWADALAPHCARCILGLTDTVAALQAVAAQYGGGPQAATPTTPLLLLLPEALAHRALLLLRTAMADTAAALRHALALVTMAAPRADGTDPRRPALWCTVAPHTKAHVAAAVATLQALAACAHALALPPPQALHGVVPTADAPDHAGAVLHPDAVARRFGLHASEYAAAVTDAAVVLVHAANQDRGQRQAPLHHSSPPFAALLRRAASAEQLQCLASAVARDETLAPVHVALLREAFPDTIAAVVRSAGILTEEFAAHRAQSQRFAAVSAALTALTAVRTAHVDPLHGECTATLRAIAECSLAVDVALQSVAAVQQWVVPATEGDSAVAMRALRRAIACIPDDCSAVVSTAAAVESTARGLRRAHCSGVVQQAPHLLDGHAAALIPLSDALAALAVAVDSADPCGDPTMVFVTDAAAAVDATTAFCVAWLHGTATELDVPVVDTQELARRCDALASGLRRVRDGVAQCAPAVEALRASAVRPAAFVSTASPAVLPVAMAAEEARLDAALTEAASRHAARALQATPVAQLRCVRDAGAELAAASFVSSTATDIAFVTALADDVLESYSDAHEAVSALLALPLPESSTPVPGTRAHDLSSVADDAFHAAAAIVDCLGQALYAIDDHQPVPAPTSPLGVPVPAR